MSTSPFHFHNQPFTSTLHQHEHERKSLFNVWIVILTAVFFFTILSWYNFGLAVYNWFVNLNDSNRTTLRNDIISTLGFALSWTLVAILLYFLFDYLELIYGETQLSNDSNNHPLLRSEARDITKSADIGRSLDVARAI